MQKKNQALGVSVHDPSIVEADGSYYIFGSHMAAAKSENLTDWKMFAEGVNARNKLFSNLFDDEMSAFSYVDKFTDGGYAVWAPDVIYNEKMGKWVMYFCTSHDYMTSNLCMAVADEVTGPYTYTKTLLYSGFSSVTVEKTNFYEVMGENANVREYLTSAKYNNLKYPNCIDPTIFYDNDGRMWVVYGSWSGGIWLLEVDEETGELIHPETSEEEGVDKYFGKRLIGGLHNSCEGPYIYFDESTGFYYLTVSYGELTREGGYQIRVFRSENVDGPYVDAKGETLSMVANHADYGVKMLGNYMLPSLKTAYMAPGHNSVLHKDGESFLVYHQRFDSGNEYHEPRVHKLFMTKEGWPVAALFAYDGKENTKTEYTSFDVEGKWFFLNHGTDISKEIHTAEEVILKNGKYKGSDVKGTYSLTEASAYMDITIEDETYSGVLADMTDEAGNNVRCFMGVGENNETLWGVMYTE